MKLGKFSSSYLLARHNIVSRSRSKRTLLISRNILYGTSEIFAEYSKKQQEAVIFWYGREFEADKIDVVLSLAIPKAEHSSGNYHVPMKEATKVGHAMLEKSLVCLAQIHTHPGTNTTHSDFDDDNAISKRNGFLSLVAPRFGVKPLRDLSDVSIHESWNNNWEILDVKAKSQRIVIIDDFLDFRNGGLS